MDAGTPLFGLVNQELPAPPPTLDAPIVDSGGEPVAVIGDISGPPSRWPW